jgi:hypothetical protein
MQVSNWRFRLEWCKGCPRSNAKSTSCNDPPVHPVASLEVRYRSRFRARSDRVATGTPALAGPCGSRMYRAGISQLSTTDVQKLHLAVIGITDGCNGVVMMCR